MAGAFVPKETAAIRKRLRDEFERFHWAVNKKPKDRLALLKLIVEFDIDVRATISRNVLPRYQERGRGHCFGALLVDFGAAGGKELTIDRRDTDEKNDRDKRHIERFVQQAILPVDFQHSFQQPSAEPILRIADAVAGAVQAQFSEKYASYLLPISGQLRLRILP